MNDRSTVPEANTAAIPWHDRNVQMIALVILVCLGIVLRLAAQEGVHQRSPDEQAYTAAANALLLNGKAALPALAESLHGDTMSASNPVRAGYLFVLSRVMELTGAHTEDAGATLACAASIASVVLLAMFAWRRFSPMAALAATLLYAVSPAALMTSRRAWEEAVVEMLALLFLFLAAEATAGSRSLPLAILFACAGLFSITVKQTAAASFVVCAVWILSVLLARNERRNALWFAGLCAIATAMACGSLMYLLGGLRAFLFLEQTNSLDGNAYSVAYEGGPAWWLARGFWSISPVAALLFVAALAWALNLKRPIAEERRIAILLVLFTAFFLIPAMLMPHHLNLRYVAATFAPIYLLCGIGAAYLISLAPTRATFPIATLLLIVAAGTDYARFNRQFAATDMQDLSIRMLLKPQQPPAPTLAATPPPDAAHWIAISIQAAQRGDCTQTTEAASKAIQLDPNSAIAWNNLAAGYECSKQWEPAISAARHALELQPDFQLAKNNLNWSLEQQRLESSKK